MDSVRRCWAPANEENDHPRSDGVSVCNVHIVAAIMGNRLSRPLSLPHHHKSDRRSLRRSNPPHPKASVTLPPEVMDKILEHIHVNGWKSPTLCACALVATWWTGPSQRRLFSSVKIHPNNYKRWMNGVVLSKSKAHLLGHVRSLSDICGYEIQIGRASCRERVSSPV